MIVIENVTGLLTSHGGKDFDAICDALADAGYRFGAVVIDAALFVPQSRERVFIVAVDADAHIPAELVADGPTAPFHPPTLVAACQRQRDPIWWRLPIPPKRNTIFADIIEDEPTGVRWHTQAETDRLLEMMTPVHLAKIETAKRAGRRMVGGLYRRIRPTRTAKGPARGGPLRRRRRMPPGSDRRIQPSDDRDRRRRLGEIAASVAARGRAADGLARRLPAAQQLQRRLWPHGRRRRGPGRPHSWRSTSSSLFCRRKQIWRISPNQSRSSDADDQRCRRNPWTRTHQERAGSAAARL